MPRFQVTARNSEGEKVQLELDATTDMSAAEQLIRQGMTPITIVPMGEAKKSRQKITLFESKTVPLPEMVMFSRQMYALVKSGIPILRSIHGLEDTARSPALKAALARIKEDLGNGRPLSSAMQAFPLVFNRLFVAIVHVGENTGRLDIAFRQLTDYLELEMETRRQIKTALRYPSFVLIAMSIAMVVLNIFVIPTFAGLFSRFGADLPWATRVLITTSTFMKTYWWLLSIGAIAVFFGIRYYISKPEGRLKWHQWQLKLPIVGSILTRALMGRFTRSFAMMLRSGIPINQALSLVAEAADNDFIALHIRNMRQGVERGETLLRNFLSTQLFPELVIQMVAVGEETGQLDNMMQEAADYYEREVEYDLKTLTAKIEPILMVFIAGLVLILALGIFTPMWDMMRLFKK